DFQNIIRKSNTDMDLYTNTQLYCQKYLELELAAKSNEIITTQQESEGKDIRIAELIDNLQKEERDYLEQETQRAKKIHEDEELRRERICRYAGNKVAPSLYLQWYIVPIALVLYAIIVIGFIFLQFAFRGAAWNYAEIIFNFVSKTLFGSFDGFNIAIDTAALASIGILFRCFWKYPFNKEKLRERKMKKIEKYITKNDLN
ncbi:MAG: hypothetical protein FWD39_02905, partial [Clostridiales bacterium]|nr:hypothetical protein [Clostridiales bacterium]